MGKPLMKSKQRTAILIPDEDVVPGPAAPGPYSASFPEFSRLTVLNYEFVLGTRYSLGRVHGIIESVKCHAVRQR